MELSYKEEVGVGALVVAGLVAFTIFMFWLTGRSITSKGVPLPVEFKNVSGLKSGDPVRVSGVNKGRNAAELASDIHNTLLATQRGMKALTEATNGPIVKQTQQTLAALERVMQRLDTLLGASKVEQSGARLDTLSANLTQLTTRLTAATGSLKTVLDKMEKGEGTLGKMATDTMLYRNLNETLTSLSALLKDLRERPGRYINVKVF